MPPSIHRQIAIMLHIMQQVVLLLACIDYHNKIRGKRNLLRCSIVMPDQSAWGHLYENADSHSFTLMTGLSRDVFQMLMDTLSSGSTWSIHRTGRPHSLSPSAELGLFLFYIGSTMTLKHLCLIFGTTPAVCSRSLKKMLKAIPCALRRHQFAKVEFPDERKMVEWAQMIERREPMATDVIGFMDGLSLHSECNSDTYEQNAMYNGYHSDTMVNNVFAYGADGKVFLCGLNFPGSCHDGSITANLLPIIIEKIGSFKICIDQGFPRSGDADGILVGPYSQRSAARLSPILRPYLLKLSNAYVSLRQASEWGMRGLQGSFPRFKRRLPGNKKKRKYIIQSIVFIHNFRTHLMGCNQIKTVFDQEYERVITLNGNDRISRFYFTM